MEFDKYQKKIDKALDRFLPSARAHPKQLHKAMRHAVLTKGKRLRPILVLAIAEMYGEDIKKIMPLACAVEIVHAASLIFDDLPMADDAKTRRGNKTLHEQYNQLIAVHAALGLCAKVGEVANKVELGDSRMQKEALEILTKAVGTEGMIGGQFVDIISEGRKPDKKIIQFIYYNKTAKLFMAAAEASAVLCGATEKERRNIVEYAKNLGIAFQIRDDLLDVEGQKEKIGKDVKKDGKKMTAISLLGKERSKELMEKYLSKSEICLKYILNSQILATINNYVKEY